MTKPLKQKELSLFSLIMIAIGATIGSGIFRTPNEIAVHLPSVGWMVIAWLVGGIVSIFGALSFGELASMFPKAGGFYNYLRLAFGDFCAFLFGWSMLLIIGSGSIAALALVFSDYLAEIIVIDSSQKLWIAAFIILFHTLVNVRGVLWGGNVAVFFTLAKLLGIAIVLIIGFQWGAQQVDILDFEFKNEGVVAQTNLFSSFGLAMIGVTFSFLGYHYVTFIAGEAENAKKNIPRALSISIIIITIVYVAMIAAYLKLLPFGTFLTSQGVAADAVQNAWANGGIFVALLICFSVFGTVGASILTIPRIIFAMAQDGLFFGVFGKKHSKYNTPHWAVLLIGLWSIVLLFAWGTFSSLISYVTFINSIFFALTASALVAFRRKKNPSVYRAWGYPVTTFIFIALMVFITINTLIQMPSQSIGGIVIVLLGWLGFRGMKKNHETKSQDR
ncbi:APC family permease [Maribacter sp.]